MNLLFIYGPPASGKLTIAEELARQTGYKLFHNHLTQDLAKELYPAFDELRFGLVDALRLATFEYAAVQDTSMVFTYVYSDNSEDNRFIAHTVTAVEKRGGRVFFVQLKAPDDVLLERVNNESRKRFHKLKDPSVLSEKLKANQYNKSVKQPGIYMLDSSKQQASESAKLIAEHFQLVHHA